MASCLRKVGCWLRGCLAGLIVNRGFAVAASPTPAPSRTAVAIMPRLLTMTTSVAIVTRAVSPTGPTAAVIFWTVRTPTSTSMRMVASSTFTRVITVFAMISSHKIILMDRKKKKWKWAELWKTRTEQQFPFVQIHAHYSYWSRFRSKSLQSIFANRDFTFSW